MPGAAVRKEARGGREELGPPCRAEAKQRTAHLAKRSEGTSIFMHAQSTVCGPQQPQPPNRFVGGSTSRFGRDRLGCRRQYRICGRLDVMNKLKPPRGSVTPPSPSLFALEISRVLSRGANPTNTRIEVDVEYKEQGLCICAIACVKLVAAEERAVQKGSASLCVKTLQH